MNTRLLKAKRVERDVLQRDLADALHLTVKTMCQKECSEENKFSADEMVTIAEILSLTPQEFDAIFFENRLSNLERNRKNSSRISDTGQVRLESESGKLRAMWDPHENLIEVADRGLKSTFYLHPDSGTYEVTDEQY